MANIRSVHLCSVLTNKVLYRELLPALESFGNCAPETASLRHACLFEVVYLLSLWQLGVHGGWQKSPLVLEGVWVKLLNAHAQF